MYQSKVMKMLDLDWATSDEEQEEEEEKEKQVIFHHVIYLFLQSINQSINQTNNLGWRWLQKEGA